MEPIEIATEKERLDIPFIHEFLSRHSYWAQGRTLEEVHRSIANSLCFGAYRKEGPQIGFARVVTDGLVFAWLMDVFVSPEFRGKGVGRQLVRTVLSHPILEQVKGIGLRTEDAHGLYRSFGFGDLPKPETWMYRPKEQEMASGETQKQRG